MSKKAPKKAKSSKKGVARTSTGARRVARAVSDLRRGLPVIIMAAEGAGLAAATEQLSATGLEELAALGNEAPRLALTGRRATFLHILPAGHPVQLVPVPARMDARALRELADATHDLAAPLRGPFQQVKAPPPTWASAAVTLCKLARLLPSAVVAAIDDGAAQAIARDHDLLIVSDAEIFGYEDTSASTLEVAADAHVPLADAESTRIIAFRPDDGGVEHLAIVIGDPDRHAPVLTRLHSECFTGDLLGSLKCDCGEQLRGAIAEIAADGGGVLLYLAQEGRGIGLINKLRAYRLQDQGFDTIEANERLGFDPDERIFRPAAEMLRRLGIEAVRLMTNNPEKVAGLEANGIRVAARVAHAFPANNHNERYLLTKKRRSGHYL